MNKNKIIITFIILSIIVGVLTGWFIGEVLFHGWIGAILGGAIACGIEFRRQIKTYK